MNKTNPSRLFIPVDHTGEITRSYSPWFVPGRLARACCPDRVVRVAKLTVAAACIATCMLGPFTGCQSPLFQSDQWKSARDYDVPADRLRSIDRFDPTERATEVETLEQAEASAAPLTDSAADQLARYRSALGIAQETDPDTGLPTAALTLDECRAHALTNNLDLKVQLLSPTISQQSISEERARFEALIFANGNLSKNDTPTSSTLSGSQVDSLSGDLGVRVPLHTGGQLTFDLPVNKVETNNVFSTLNPSYSSDFSISLSQPLLRNAGKRVNDYSIRIAEYQNLQTEARTKLEIIRVLADVDRGYWRLYAARRALEVTMQEYDLAVAQLARAQRMVDAGSSPEVEVIRAESGVAERLEAIIIAENTLRSRERDLKRMLNNADLSMETTTVIVPGTEPNPMHFVLNPTELADASLDQRMDLLDTEIQLAQNRDAIDLARNGMLPLVNLTYRYNVNGLGETWNESFDLLVDKSYEDHAVGVSVEIPLGNKGAKAGYRRALLSRLQTLATLEQRENMIRQEVYNTVDQLETNWQRVLASRQAAMTAARNLEAEQRQYTLGLRTSTDVLDAQARFSSTQLSEIRALTEYEIAKVDLAVATGTLLGAANVVWEPDDPLADEIE